MKNEDFHKDLTLENKILNNIVCFIRAALPDHIAERYINRLCLESEMNKFQKCGSCYRSVKCIDMLRKESPKNAKYGCG